MINYTMIDDARFDKRTLDFRVLAYMDVVIIVSAESETFRYYKSRNYDIADNEYPLSELSKHISLLTDMAIAYGKANKVHNEYLKLVDTDE